MKIIKFIKRRIYRFFHPTLEDSIRKFTTSGDWVYEEWDKWDRRFDKIFRFPGKDKKQ